MKLSHTQPTREQNLSRREVLKQKQYGQLAQLVTDNPGTSLNALNKVTGYMGHDLVQRLLKAGCVQRKGRWYPR